MSVHLNRFYRISEESVSYIMKAKTKDRIRRCVSIVSIIGFLACSAALLYPIISDRWNRYRDSLLIAEYNQIITQTDPKVYNEMMKNAEDYNSKLVLQHRNIITDAAYNTDEEYESLLSITGNGMMCYVEIPKIDITEPVYHYSNEISLGEGVGHIHGSSLPIGGKSTHTVLTGHRGLPGRKFFSDLDRLNIGDRFYIHVMGKPLAYQVYLRRIIEPSDVSGLMIEEGKDLATLITCEPYGVNTHRMVLTGKRIPFDQANVKDGYVTTEEHEVIIDPAVWVAAGFIAFVVYMIVSSIVRSILRKRRRKRKLAQKKALEEANKTGQELPENSGQEGPTEDGENNGSDSAGTDTTGTESADTDPAGTDTTGADNADTDSTDPKA